MKCMVLDGNSILNRAFYGVRMLNTKDGTPTNAVYGFLNILQKLLAEENPDGLCVTFDVKAPTFRHEQYDQYKAGRKPMPDELRLQMPLIKEVLGAMNIPCYELAGYEADDLIGTIATRLGENGDHCVIVTGDKDNLQLVTTTTTVALVTTRMGQTKTERYTPEKVEEVYGFSPSQLIDLKALMGDSSDNIPGVPGVGEKTALDLIQRYSRLEEIYTHLDELEIKDGVRKKLRDGETLARLSYTLGTIFCDVPLDFSPFDTLRKPPDAPALQSVFERLEFRSMMQKFGISAMAQQATTAETATVKLEHIQSEAALDVLLARIRAAEYIAVRTLDGLDSIEIGEEDRVSVVQWSAVGDRYNPFLRELFGTGIQKVGHHVKDTMRQLLAEGITAEGYVFDTALAAYLINPTKSTYPPEDLAAEYLATQTTEPTHIMHSLYPALKSQLESSGLWAVFSEIELPLCAVLAKMEHTGFLVDRAALKSFGDMLSDRIGTLEEAIFSQAGETFNISSPKQLGHILFHVLGLPPSKKTKTGYSTNVEVLEKLKDQHAIIPNIMEFRELTKLKGTYADGLIRVIEQDGRIRSHFQMTITATGRLSSTEPNLQNIPVRKALGGEVRKMFVAAPGHVLVDADYSQIELRILAHISDDAAMQAAFRTGEDIHTVTAAQVFGAQTSDVTDDMRRAAKAVNFGIVYGISAFSLAQDIGVSQFEAKHYIESYLAKYSGVKQYMANVVEQAKETGKVVTLFGRTRPMPELNAPDFNTRSFGERIALNMPIQGTAADIIKLAMIRVHTRLHQENLQAKLVLQVHDELIVECPEDEAETVRTLLREEMERVATLSVPLVAEAKSGKSWYDTK